SYECVIVDEVHGARRKNLGPDRENENPDPNNLLSFLYEISPRTKSMLLATATPVQLYPVEAWDLLNILAVGSDAVLGNDYSHWRHAGPALKLMMRQTTLSEEDAELWNWIRNPLPPSSESRDFAMLRRSLKLKEEDVVVSGNLWLELSDPDKARIRRLARAFGQQHNPFIRHIVRRTRQYLETTLDPETNEPYLKPVKVELFGESDREAINLPGYLRSAYQIAEDFCHALGSRVKGSGFMKTLLLRRVGSTIYAGQRTAENMLGDWRDIPEEEEDEDCHDEPEYRSLTPSERLLLQNFVNTLKAN
ncbi:MAG: helicase SNF2, partial [Terriglobia bacterium]